MDQPLRHNFRLIFTVVFISQVCGTPIFWSQPDCYQNQFGDVQYDSYQGPSYQETLQKMAEETLNAIRQIILVTARITKQELVALASIFQNPNVEDCNSSGGGGDAPDDLQFVQHPVKFPGADDSLPYPVEPLNETPVIAELPVAAVADRNSSGPSQSVDNKSGVGEALNSSAASQVQNANSIAATDNNSTTSTTPNFTQSNNTSGNSVTGNEIVEPNTTTSSNGESISSNSSADDTDALFFSTEQPYTEAASEGLTTTTSEMTTVEILAVGGRKPKL